MVFVVLYGLLLVVCKDFFGGLVTEDFSWLVIEFVLDIPDILVSKAGNVTTLWYIVANQPVNVFNATFLPRVVGLAEVDWRLDELRKLGMLLESDVVI